MAGRIEQTTLAAHLRPNQQFNTITYLDAGGDSYYHAFQLTLRKRFNAGLLLGLAYSFSKSIDDQSVDPVGSSSGGGLTTTNSRTPTDIRNWRNERALSDFDRTHVVTTNFVYDLPVGKGRTWLRSAPGVVNHVIGGWSINGLYTYMSGEPFSVNSGVRTNNYSHISRADFSGPNPAVHYRCCGRLRPRGIRQPGRLRISSAGFGRCGPKYFPRPAILESRLERVKAFRYYRAVQATIPRRSIQLVYRIKSAARTVCPGPIRTTSRRFLRDGTLPLFDGVPTRVPHQSVAIPARPGLTSRSGSQRTGARKESWRNLQR